MNASEEHLRAMRQAVYKSVARAGIGEEAAESARPMPSELVGNAVRACGPRALFDPWP
ncbi:hypothetical protein ABZ379_33190 [Streptomyces canus]|uniref:hypothetical protein n=1 Tax=Streptomyces canus TaxID=58343 RepID=UPI0033DE0AC4